MKKIIERFVPTWFSLVMGTGILPVALMLGSNWVPMYKPLAEGFFVLSIVLFFIILVPWSLRFVMYPKAVKKDLFHPILGSFFPTMPISLLILSVDFLTIGENISIIGKDLAIEIAVWLFILGTIGIIILGLIILPIMFIGENIDLKHANFGWFIPPVSHLFITVVGLSLMKYYPKSSAANALFLVSMIGFGIGMMLFIFVGAIVYHRYTYHELPPSSIASTFFIGIAPSATVAIISVKAYGALMFTTYSLNMEVVHTLAKLSGIIFWGFSIWWFLMAVIMLLEKIIKNDLPFALSWWAFVFPIGALAVSTGVINKILPNIIFPIILQILIVIFLLIWLMTLVNTLLGIKNRKLFK